MRRATLLAAAALASVGPALGQSAPDVRLLDSAGFAAPRLTESSGVAASNLARGVYWSHNDSGDTPALYATDSAGTDLGFVRVVGAAALDWEDLSAGACLVAPGRCLYVADIGDNRSRRGQVVIYRVPEPTPPLGPSDTLRTVSALDSLTLRYPDGPHDAEAFVVTDAGVAFIAAKDRFGPALLFRTTLGPGSGTRALELVGALPLRASALTGRLVTGAAASPDGRLLVVRTYVSLHFFRMRGDSLPEPLGSPNGVPIPVVEPQGEGVTFDGADRLVLTSERGLSTRGMILRLLLVRRER